MSEKILVIDDEPKVVRLVSEVLAAVGYRVVAAAGGKTGSASAAEAGCGRDAGEEMRCRERQTGLPLTGTPR